MNRRNIVYLVSTVMLFLSSQCLSSQSQSFPIDLTKLGPGDSIVISYEATVSREIPADLDSVHCQTTVTAGNGAISVLSDDPRTGADLDPTSIGIAVPTMSQWGIIILGLLLMNFAVVGLLKTRKTRFM